jgi:hypothetical protein
VARRPQAQAWPPQQQQLQRPADTDSVRASSVLR